MDDELTHVVLDDGTVVVRPWADWMDLIAEAVDNLEPDEQETPMKLKTAGLSPKVPAQAITTLVVAALAYFGIDLDAEVSAALGVVIGFGAGYLAPATPALPVPVTRKGEAGQSLVELLIAVLVIVILVVVLLRIA